MSAPSRLPPPSDPALLPILATGVYLAALVALWGFLSLILNREVIDRVDAGPLLGPAIAVAACVVTWLACWRGRHALSVVVALLGSYLAMVVVAAIGFSAGAGGVVAIPAFAVYGAISPFVIGAAVLSGLTVLAMRLIRPVDRPGIPR